jgi:hypothetical protein
MAGTERRLFLSAVSREFASCRVELDKRLRDHFQVHTQEYFAQGSGRLLDHLDQYIETCDAVVHLEPKVPCWRYTTTSPASCGARV